MTIDIPLRWIDDETPIHLRAGTTLGVPLDRGLVTNASELAVVNAAGDRVPAQTWTLATWPDGSLKWAGIGLAATDTPAASYRVVVAEGMTGDLRVEESADSVIVDTGAARLVIPRSGEVLVSAIEVDGRPVGLDGRLVASSQVVPEPAHDQRTQYAGCTESVEVEQSGPTRAVIRICGTYQGDGRSWLPYTVRIIIAAGARTFRLVHSFTFDGNPDRDFLSSLGLRFETPLDSPHHDRHIRLAGADGGVLREAVQGITGLRRDPGPDIRTAQMAGEALPSLDQWDARVSERLQWVPTWGDYTLRQLSANGFTIRKRTKPGHGWIQVAEGTRADGYAYLGDTQGGIAIGLEGFWQSHPTSIDIRNAATDRGELTMWLWSPDADPMDLRFYHDGLGQDGYADQLDALEITYEDYEPGMGSAHGIARTHELVVTAYPGTPSHEEFAEDAAAVARRPRLCATPEALQGCFGDWDLVNRDTPERAALEDRLELGLDYYLGQIDQHHWYGFWNYGDIMHSYDTDRHTWRYDVGGFAWDNSELESDLWLWTSFLRTGRADVFRMAEAMARHTGDVDVHHIGPWAGLGSRHNVQHWGCSAKQLRIGSPAFRRPHYFLTADDRSRDLMLALRNSDETFLTLDATRKVRPDAATYEPQRNAVAIGLGTDYSGLAATWLADWEITGNERSRDRLLGTMQDIADMKNGFFTGEALYDVDTGRFDTSRERVSVSHLSAIFGLVSLCSELIRLVDVPGFRDAWLQYCRLYLGTEEELLAELGEVPRGINFPQWHSRLLAYAAAQLGDDDLADRAWAAYFEGGEIPNSMEPVLRRIQPPHVLAPVDEIVQFSTNDVAQSSLAIIQNLSLIEHRLNNADDA